MSAPTLREYLIQQGRSPRDALQIVDMVGDYNARPEVVERAAKAVCRYDCDAGGPNTCTDPCKRWRGSALEYAVTALASITGEKP